MLDRAIVIFAILYCKFVNKQQWGQLDTLWCSDCTTMNSLTWFDKYSFVHFFLGVYCFIALYLTRTITGWSAAARHTAMILVVCGFEMMENRPRNFRIWDDWTYHGDALINSVTDILVAIMGYSAIARLGVLPLAFVWLSLKLLNLFPSFSDPVAF